MNNYTYSNGATSDWKTGDHLLRITRRLLFSLSHVIWISAAMAVMPASATGTNRFEVPFNVTAYCPGDEINLEGTMRVVERFKIVRERLNFTAHANVFQTGYSENTGARYTASWHQNYSFHDESDSPPYPTVYIDNQYGVLIGEGDAPDYQFKFKVKFVLANDEIVVDEVDVELGECTFL